MSYLVWLISMPLGGLALSKYTPPKSVINCIHLRFVMNPSSHVMLTAGRTLMGDSLGFHILFALLGVGLPLFISLFEFLGIYLNDKVYYQTARRLGFWHGYLVCRWRCFWNDHLIPDESLMAKIHGIRRTSDWTAVFS